MELQEFLVSTAYVVYVKSISKIFQGVEKLLFLIMKNSQTMQNIYNNIKSLYNVENKIQSFIK